MNPARRTLARSTASALSACAVRRSPSAPASRWCRRSTPSPAPRPAERRAPTPSTVVQARAGADDPGTEPRSSTASWSRSPTAARPRRRARGDDADHARRHDADHARASTTPTTPDVTTPTLPEPGDDNGNDGGAVTPVPSGTQSFSSAGGSITVTVSNGSRSRWRRARPAAGFGAEVHDNGPSRVEVALHERPDRVAHPDRARQRRAHVGDHPARVTRSRHRLSRRRGACPRSTARAGTPPPATAPLRRASSTRLCTTVPSCELDAR